MTPYIAIGLPPTTLKQLRLHTRRKRSLKDPDIVDRIITAVEDHTEIPFAEMLMKSSKPKRSEARQLVMYFMARKTTLSLKEIGKRVDRDHSTVIYACRHVAGLIDTEPALAELATKIERDIHK